MPYRRNQHRASSVHRGVWTMNFWGTGVTPITTEPCVPHGKSCWIIFQLIWHHKVRKVKSVPLYRTLESISDTWFFNVPMVCCPFSNSSLHYCQTRYLSAFRSKGKGGYHYIVNFECIKIYGAIITQFCLYSSEQVKWDY